MEGEREQAGEGFDDLYFDLVLQQYSEMGL